MSKRVCSTCIFSVKFFSPFFFFFLCLYLLPFASNVHIMTCITLNGLGGIVVYQCHSISNYICCKFHENQTSNKKGMKVSNIQYGGHGGGHLRRSCHVINISILNISVKIANVYRLIKLK